MTSNTVILKLLKIILIQTEIEQKYTQKSMIKNILSKYIHKYLFLAYV